MKKMKEDLVANFMSLPNSEDILFQSKPKSFSKIIEKTWENWGIGVDRSPEKTISENWHKVVGRSFSTKCAPAKLTENGLLIIKTSSSPIKQDLSFSKDRILSTVRKLDGCSFIRGIKFH